MLFGAVALILFKIKFFFTIFIRETPIPKAKRIGIGKLNNPPKQALGALYP
jgi:hypothetical protein